LPATPGSPARCATPACENPVTAPSPYCDPCRERRRLADRERRQEERAAGICERCHTRKRASHSLSRCQVCLDKTRADQAQLRAELRERRREAQG